MSDDYGYIGRAACGCLRACTVDSPEYRRQVAREIASWVRQGLTVERRTIEEIRGMSFACPHKVRGEGGKT